jgi:hypothetical protein
VAAQADKSFSIKQDIFIYDTSEQCILPSDGLLTSGLLITGVAT